MNLVNKTIHQINETLKKSRSYYSTYSCETVSWDDVQRSKDEDILLSCWGSNISDTRLYAKDGRLLYTVRSNNWNERLGIVKADELFLVVNKKLMYTSNHPIDNNKDLNNDDEHLSTYSLKDVLKQMSIFGAYAGFASNHTNSSFYIDSLDEKVSVRFQTTFLPLVDDLKESEQEKKEGEQKNQHVVMEFVPEAYNYNTTSDIDPRNLILLCTSQGLALQQDGAGAKKLFHHSFEETETYPDGTNILHHPEKKKVIHRYWLEAEYTSHKVGGSQTETKEEREDAISRGKATSCTIGTRAMETRFNALMTIQIPLKQKEKNDPSNIMSYAEGMNFKKAPKTTTKTRSNPLFKKSCIRKSMNTSPEAFSSAGPVMEQTEYVSMDSFVESSMLGGSSVPFHHHESEEVKTRQPVVDIQFGTSSAARVSRGSKEDTWDGLTVTNPQRNGQEHITATIVMYYLCRGGVPTETDIMAAIDDLESLYQSVEVSGNLADCTFDFMKSSFTNEDMMDIATKIITQPPKSDQ